MLSMYPRKFLHQYLIKFTKCRLKEKGKLLNQGKKLLTSNSIFDNEHLKNLSR